MMPFNEDIRSWAEYMSWKGVNKDAAITEGKKDKTIKERKSGLLFERNTPLETKFTLLKEGLKRSPVCLSVWGVPDGDTYAVKPEGVWDTHLVEAIFLEGKKIWVLDTYEPFIKILPENYNSDFALGRIVNRLSIPKKNRLQDLIEKLIEFVKDMLFKW
jgi:hypothetical protein